MRRGEIRVGEDVIGNFILRTLPVVDKIEIDFKAGLWVEATLEEAARNGVPVTLVLGKKAE